MRRRSFLLLSAAGAVVSQLLARVSGAGALAATASVDGGSLVALKKAGSLLLKDTRLGPVLLLSEGAKVLALDPRCPHKGCLVDWVTADQALVCPCHAAHFTSAGVVIGQGKAKSPLITYKVKVKGDRIAVRAA